MEKFYYSQSSLAVYEKCPKMFEYVYIDGLSGEAPTPEFRQKTQMGIEFHLLAERYFNGMDDYFYVEEPKLLKWMAILEDEFSMDIDGKSEVEIKQNQNGIRIMAKYDLIYVEDEKIKIVDFKTNEKEYEINKLEENIQTKVYMYILGENLSKVYPNMKLEDISIEYFQLNFPKSKKIIKYNEKKHEKNKLFLENIIKKIEKSKINKFDKKTINCDFCRLQVVCRR
jgi:hypothetical protein